MKLKHAQAFVNNNCNGSGPHAIGVVKIMRHGAKGTMSGNDILCRTCWYKEIVYRKMRNKDLADFAKFDLPTWQDAEIYES